MGTPARFRRRRRLGLDAGKGSGGPPVAVKSSGDAALNGEQDGGEGKARGVRWRAMGAREATVTVGELR